MPMGKLPSGGNMGQDNSLSRRELPVKLGVGVSNDETAGTKAGDSASESDRARSVPDSRTHVQVQVMAGPSRNRTSGHAPG